MSDHVRFQGNRYDKIFRENMEANLDGIIQDVLGMKIVSSEEIADDIQHTKERKPDLLKRVQNASGETFILHMEYQKANDKDMVYRMAEYSIMLQWKYRLPVQQFMIYIGMGKSTMPTHIITKNFKFRYHTTSLSKVNYKVFLNGDKIEQKLLAVLGDMDKDSPTEVLTQIVTCIRNDVEGDLSKDRYLNQLRVLAQLRNLDKQLNEVMVSIDSFFKMERDPFYKRGLDEGISKGEIKGKLVGKAEVALRMSKAGFLIEQIIIATGLSKQEINVFIDAQ